MISIILKNKNYQKNGMKMLLKLWKWIMKPNWMININLIEHLLELNNFKFKLKIILMKLNI